MDKDAYISYWMQSAENDLKAAEGLFSTGNYAWSLFIGHLVLEKTLKALYIEYKNDNYPPKIHNLARLSQLCNLDLSEEYDTYLIKANKFHIEGRYPEYKLEFYKQCTYDFALENLIKIKEIHQWLKSRLK